MKAQLDLFLLFFFSQITEDHSKNGRSEKRISTASKPHSDLVKWQGTPIRTPLLRLPPDLSPLALECFDCILRYCGDLPPDPESTEVKCVYTVLMVRQSLFFALFSLDVHKHFLIYCIALSQASHSS